MSDLITQEIFTDGQQNINAANMNGIIGKAVVQPDIIATKATSATMDVADLFLVLKTNNTLAKARFDTLTNSVASTLPLADTTKNGMLRQGTGLTTDYVGGDNQCHPLSGLLPAGVVVDYAGPNIPAGWLLCNGTSLLRTTYPALFAAIGGTHGAVDGTHFTLPNFINRVAIGAGSTYALAAVGGGSTAQLLVTNMPNHTHAITDQLHGHTASSADSGHQHTYVWPSAAGSQWAASPGAWGQGSSATGTGYAQISTSVANAYSNINTTQGVPGAASAAFSIMNPYLAVYKIIKY